MKFLWMIPQHIQPQTKVVYNNQIYDMGYYSSVEGRCILYLVGCQNMQDSFSVDTDKVRIANQEDLKYLKEGR
ncbi:MAG: hypothetical protein M0R03_21935 [Novosphingobium sp.]|nr:hypothetical protein [Novosphingobium sp.]